MVFALCSPRLRAGNTSLPLSELDLQCLKETRFPLTTITSCMVVSLCYLKQEKKSFNSLSTMPCFLKDVFTLLQLLLISLQLAPLLHFSPFLSLYLHYFLLSLFFIISSLPSQSISCISCIFFFTYIFFILRFPLPSLPLLYFSSPLHVKEEEEESLQARGNRPMRLAWRRCFYGTKNGIGNGRPRCRDDLFPLSTVLWLLL